MRIEIDFHGERVSREILRTGERAENAQPAFDAIGNRVLRITKLQYATRGTRGGTQWRKLKDTTKARKRRKGLDPRILRATLDLYRSVTNKGDPNMVYRVSDDSFTFGTKVGYLKYHQSKEPRYVLPRRPIFAFTPGDKRDIVKDLQRWIITGQI